jgi:hypothetical protein
MVWRASLLLILIVSAGGRLTRAQEVKEAAKEAEGVELHDGFLNISFAPPDGFHALNDKQVELIRSKGVPVKFIYADATLGSMVIINTYGDEASEKGLSQIRRGFEDAAKKAFPNLVWLNRERVTINGQKWLRLRYKSGPNPDDFVTDFYVIAWAGKFVIFNFAIRVSKYETYKDALEKSLKTIELSISVIAPAVEDAKPVKP